MNLRPSRPSRLIRTGTVGEVGSGCTSIEVSVPCSTCHLGCAGSLVDGRRLVLTPASGGADLQAGDGVRVSVDAAGLAAGSARLFAPVLVWAILAASLSADVTWFHGVLIVAGLAVSLLLGRYLVRGSERLLDVQAERVASESEPHQRKRFWKER